MSTIWFMPSSGSADVTPTPSGSDWTLHVNTVSRPLPSSRAGASAMADTTYTPDAGDHLTAGSAMVAQFVSEILPAQTFPAQSIQIGIRALEAVATNNLVLRWKVYVVSVDGTTVIGTIVPAQNDGTELGGVDAGRVDLCAASTSVVASTQCRMVLEVGVSGTPTSSGSTDGHNSTFRFGEDTAGTYGWVQESSTTGEPIPYLLFAHDVDELVVDSPADVTQHRLMLSDGADPDIANTNITAHNEAPAFQTLVKYERGYQRAIVGEPPAAGAMSVTLVNDSLARYQLDEPEPGLALRLNKFVSGVAYSMAQVNLDDPVHTLSGIRPIVRAQGFGSLAKLANRKLSTALYKNITTGAAIGHLLDAAGFPAFLRDLDTGEVTLRYWWLNDEDALTALQTLINSEGVTAMLYEQGDGSLRFMARSARFTESRCTTPQSAFTSQGSAPRLSDFQYFTGGREVVNEATHDRVARNDDPDGAQIVWQDVNGDGNYILAPDQSLVFIAVAEEPFFDAITPVLDTDYEVGIGSVSVTLERDSGQRTRITFLAGGSGATIGGVGSNNITLRATLTFIGATFSETSSIDATTSIAKYGLRPWNGQMSRELEWWDIRDNLDAIVAWKQNPSGRVRIRVLAHGSSANNLAIAQRDIGDMVSITNQNHDFEASAWIMRIEHEVVSPASIAEADASQTGAEYSWYECMVVEVEAGSSGSGVGPTNPYDDIDNSGFIDA